MSKKVNKPMEFSSSSDEDNLFEQWNNWKPSRELFRKKKLSTNNLCFDGEIVTLPRKVEDKPRFGAWLVPLNILNSRCSIFLKKKTCIQNKKKNKEKIVKYVPRERVEASGFDSGKKVALGLKEVFLGKEISWNRGRRVKLHDVTKYKDGEMVWGYVSAGVFGQIKLWLNEYGYICGSADGCISEIGSPEMSYISILNPQLLRKMLNISTVHWSLLSEMVYKTKSTLKFEALAEFNVKQESKIDKLWFFLCKRRHFFPEQCMLLKLNGAVKCLKEFKIVPKLVVQDIRINAEEGQISLERKTEAMIVFQWLCNAMAPIHFIFKPQH